MENKFSFVFQSENDPERGGRELSIAHKIGVETCREGSHTPSSFWEGGEGGRSHGSATSHTRHFALMQVLKKSFHLFFNLKPDPERGGRQLSIAHLDRAETCREGSHTPLQVSEKGVKGGRSDLDFAQNPTQVFLFEQTFRYFF